MTDRAVEARGLTKRYRGRPALDSVSFTVAEGEVFGVIGPNGAGKTTLIEILEGFRTADEGDALVLGLDPRRQRAALNRQMGVMLQEGGVHPALRAREVIRLFASYYDDPVDPDALIEQVGLSPVAGQRYRRMSGGEKQRLALALALVGRPRLAFLDEPTAGMDPRARALTWQVIEDLRARGATVVMATHDMQEAERLCDRVAVIAGGRLAAMGSPRSLTAGPAVVRFAVAGAVPLDLDALNAHLDATVTPQGGGEYVITGEPSPEMTARLSAWLAERDIALARLQASASLEDVFMTLTGDEPE